MGSFVKLGRFKIIFTDYQNYNGCQKLVYQIIKNQIKVNKITVNQILGNQIADRRKVRPAFNFMNVSTSKLCESAQKSNESKQMFSSIAFLY